MSAAVALPAGRGISPGSKQQRHGNDDSERDPVFGCRVAYATCVARIHDAGISPNTPKTSITSTVEITLGGSSRSTCPLCMAGLLQDVAAGINETRQMTMDQIAKALGSSTSTVYRYLKVDGRQ